MRSKKGEFIVVFKAFYSNEGHVTKYYQFDSLKEAQDMYSSWSKCRDSGILWSDGPETMRIVTKTKLSISDALSRFSASLY